MGGGSYLAVRVADHLVNTAMGGDLGDGADMRPNHAVASCQPSTAGPEARD